MVKFLKKITFSMVLFGMAVCASPKNAKADVGIIKMAGYTDNSITVEWQPQNNPNYKVNSYSIKDKETDRILWTGDADTVKATIQKPKGYIGEWELLSNRTYTTEYGGTLDAHVDFVYVNTTPADMTKKQFGIANLYPNKKQIMFDINAPEGQSGVQFEIYNAKKKRIVSKDSGNLAGEMMKYANDSAYRYRARCYYYNDTMRQNYYGNWSANRYFAVPSVKVKKSTAKKGINVTLKKGTGISKYTVYVSKKYDSGYKKAKTVKVAKKKTYSLSLKKYGKKKLKKGTYFVKVVPTIKDGNKTYQSETTAVEVVCVR